MTKYNSSIIENKLHPKIRLNSICPYFTMFPLSFPYKVLRYAKRTDLVYDPFCGRGTTNFAARLLGMSSYGVDSNPIAQAIAQAKLIHANPIDIQDRCQTILQGDYYFDIPTSDFWEIAYHAETLNSICKLRTYFLNQESLDEIDIALRAIVLGVLHGPKMKTTQSYLSNQMPRTYATKPDYSVRFWEKRQLVPENIQIANLIKRKSEYIFNDEIPNQTGGNIILGDSRFINEISSSKFNWVITSPPYFGMSTYKQDQWLRNWFLGGSSDVDYSNKTQLKHGSEITFIDDLSKVWINTSLKCNPNARMIIRFGALPSKSEKTPSELIKESLKKANCGWKLTKICSAGEPSDSQRQANQFKKEMKKYIEEIDVYATLKI
ncbi:site-specific DNA-methyltransferase [Dysgonomonas sp. HDW5B]|uniref:DNA methyltransferase n=1 Tax=Dysgonomonas sp. HDW5B TaxID=2714927 RepID=UPI00140D7C3F|nr:DNA methyltransferase [Dysgonomonas sp. HDW5B]QIK53788.1 site-specific DNA-methyltransferase [Dysgonomonas sp. HDW5B]